MNKHCKLNFKLTKEIKLVAWALITILFFHLDISDNEKLRIELEKHGIGRLFPKLSKAGVTPSILWDLDEDAIKQCQLDAIENIQYKKALKDKSGNNLVYC